MDRLFRQGVQQRPQAWQMHDIISIVTQQELKCSRITTCFVSVPEPRRIPSGHSGCTPHDAKLLLYLFQAPFEPMAPAIAHKVVMPEIALQICVDAPTNDGEVEASTVVGVERLDAFERSIYIDIGNTPAH